MDGLVAFRTLMSALLAKAQSLTYWHNVYFLLDAPASPLKRTTIGGIHGAFKVFQHPTDAALGDD